MTHHRFQHKIRQRKAFSRRKGGALSSGKGVAMADFCEIPEGTRRILARKAANRPSDEPHRYGRFAAFLARMGTRRWRVMNAGRP